MLLLPFEVQTENCPGCGTPLRAHSPLFKTCRIGKPLMQCGKCGQESVSTRTAEWQCLSSSNRIKYACNATTVALLVGVFFVGGTVALVTNRLGTELGLSEWLGMIVLGAAFILSWHAFRIIMSMMRTRDADYWHKLYTAGAMRKQTISAAGALLLGLVVVAIVAILWSNHWAAAGS